MVIPLRKQEKDHTAEKLVDEVLLEAHLREVYGVEEWDQYKYLVEYIKYLQEQVRFK